MGHGRFVGSEVCGAGGSFEHFAVDHETGFLGNLVVELHGRGVGLVGVPVDAARSGQRRAAIDFLDERAAKFTGSYSSKNLAQVRLVISSGSAVSFSRP